jgi:hypothetical protein
VTRDHYNFIAVSAIMPVFGWAVVVLTSRIERQRRERHAHKFIDYSVTDRSALSRARLLRRRVRLAK